MDNIIGVTNPYGLIQQAGKRRKRKTYKRKKHLIRKKTRKIRR